jgi:hypothetical protein
MTTTSDLFTKDPQAVLDYEFDWSAWLDVGETITTSTVSVPTGIVLDSHSELGGVVIAWLSGGTAGVLYRVVSHVVTSSGRQDDRTIRVSVQER